MRMQTIEIHSGVTATSSPSRKTDGPGHGKASPDTGSYAGKSLAILAWRRECWLTAIIQDQHDGLDCRVYAAVSRPQRTASDRMHGRSRPDIGAHCCPRRMARESSILGLHSALSSFMGHERRLLACLESDHDGLCLDGHSGILGWARSVNTKAFSVASSIYELPLLKREKSNT